MTMNHKVNHPKTLNILVLCTGNSARSIMSEALINVLGEGRFYAYSAGSQPTGFVNPFAAEQANSIGYPLENVRSKSWDEFSQPESPKMDVVITVCDSAAGETCPLWRGTPIKVHWGFEDPSHVHGTDDEKHHAFKHTFSLIRQKIEQLVNIPFEILSLEELIDALNQIGENNA
jgi:arsenate reductase